MAVQVGERRIVSVLIADVVGSTAIGERLGPERSKFLFDEVIRLMSDQVRRYEGTVAQLAGDSLLAFFGAPVAHEDDPERAVRAALAIQRAIAQYAEEVRAAYGVDLGVRVAVNTGPVVVSHEDGDLRWNALGDTVNVAARLEKQAGKSNVAIGDATKRQIEDCFELEELGPLELDGRHASVQTWRVVGVREDEVSHPDRPLVGRDFELTVLERTVDALAEGRGTIVSIIGEPGIGKSRLVEEVRKHYRDRIRFIEGRAVSYAQTFPYWPIRDLLREWLGVGASTPEARVRLELKAELSHVFGPRADDAYPFFATLLRLTLEPDAAERMHELNRESIQHETFELFAELVCRLSEEQPLCLVFEDLHWADESTLELLEALMPVTEEEGVGLFLLYRSEREHGSWHLGERARQRYPHLYREIELRPLPPDASKALAAIAAEGDLPESVAQLLVERAGGNPFFLEEALHDLVERGALQRRNGTWELTVGVDELAIPALVQGALQARLDRLDPKTREVLSVAAVIGRTFGMPLLERCLPHEQLIPALSELQRLDLVVEVRRRPAPEYRFRHGLVQEVAYASLVEGQRKKLHKRVGQALEDIFRESPEEVYGLLARHFTEAGEPEKAVEYLLKAGDAARAIYSDQEALEHYEKARTFLIQLGDERRARDTLFKIALAHHLAFDFEKAEEAYDEAFCCRVDEEPRLDPTEQLEVAMPKHLDEIVPGKAYTAEAAQLTEHLFRGLLLVDSELNVVPSMADNFRVSSDGLVYLFRLREGCAWSDGTPLTAEDFAFSWARMKEEQTITAFLLEDVESAEALDDRTLEVRLREPRNFFPYILASPWSFPWPRHKCEELGDDWRKPENLVSNGPFVLSHVSEDQAFLTANPYWQGARGNVAEISVSFGKTADELVEAWREGRYDFIPAPGSAFVGLEDTIIERIPELSTQYVGFRADRPPFSNELVRKAFAHALDRERLAAASELNRPVTRGGAIPPAMPGHSHRVGLEYDPELARKLLAEAGYPGGKGLPELEFLITHWLESPEVFTDQWAELGARFKVVRSGPFAVRKVGPETHLWLSGWTADYPDPDGFFRGLFQPVHRDFYVDEELEELVQRARSTRDQNERMRLYHEIDRIWVAERAAVLPVFYGRQILVRRPWLENLWANPLSGAQLDQVIVKRKLAIQVPDQAEALERQ